ncbi:MAG: hypothetical protein ACI8UO_002643 [Verrucomicrobiales bacterium]|jgi:hypothetical protein
MKILAAYSIIALAFLPFTQAAEPEFNPRTVIKKSFPPIVEPKSVSMQEAENEEWVRDDELVLGLVVNGKARAYPINTLTGPRREIINDELGGRSIAATW